MTRFTQYAFTILVVLVAATAIGCNTRRPTGAPAQFITPVPVTPITPPDGVRGSLRFDPQIYQAQQEARIAENVRQFDRTDLGLCNGESEAERTVEAEAVEIGRFVAHKYVQVCGWPRAGMDIDVALQLPDGTVQQHKIETTNQFDRGIAVASFQISAYLPASAGTYQITFAATGSPLTNSDGVFSTSYEFVLPPEPHVYAFPTGTVWLSGFEPNETVQLLRYDVSHREFVTWDIGGTGGGYRETFSLVDAQMITVDESGAKSAVGFGAPLDRSDYGPASQIIALGDISGEIPMANAKFVDETVLLE